MIFSLDKDTATGQYSYGTGMRSLVDLVENLRVRAKAFRDTFTRMKTVSFLKINRFAKRHPWVSNLAFYGVAVFALTFVSALASTLSFKVFRIFM